MDQQQLQNLLTQMAAMTAALRTHPQPSATNVNVISNFDIFDPNVETFKTYKERLEIHFEIKKVQTDKELCVKLLLQYIGSKNYALLTSLAAPKPINSLQYDEVITLLEKHFCPKKNVLVEQHKFFCELQNEKQTISEFVAQLRKRANECEFVCTCKATVSEVFLRAQFIRGLRSEHMREQLLENSEFDFENIVKKAIALEAAKMGNKEIVNNSTEINRINKMQYQKQNRREQNKNQNSNRNSKINYRKLGLEGLCLRCGRDNHMANECKANRNNLKCDICKKTGHIKKVCIQNKIKHTNSNHNIEVMSNERHVNNEVEYYGINKIIDIYNKSLCPSNDIRKFFIDVSIEGKKQSFEVDSGAGYTLLPEKDFLKLDLNIPINKTDIAFRAYTGDIFVPLGFVEVNVNYRNKHSKEHMYIVPSKHTPLLGRIWIRHLNINLQEIDYTDIQEIKSNANYTIDEILSKFTDIFQPRVGCIPNVCCNLKLKAEAKPIFVKERQVPFALREKVEIELDNLEKDGIITKVNTSDWGSPLVVIPKPDGNVRLCVDYKIAVNPQLVSAHYPIRRIDEILNSLKNAKYFCKLDLFKAYLHVEVDEDSQKIQTISTHRGTYQMKRLSFGIKTAPSEFNRILDQILAGLEGTLSYFDDIIVFGDTLHVCKERLIKCFERLQKNQLHLNKNKCEYFKEKIQYLGYNISHNTISKCKNKVEAIIKMPQPENADQVRKFLGMITYYARFIPAASALTYPLRQLLEKNKKFNWSEKCEKAFKNLKQELITDKVLVPFDTELPVILACDASPYGIGAVLSHLVKGEERPIAFISRALTKTEQNYSQLDREALAIIYAVDKFYMYLYARHFTLISDNRPLTRIFHQNAKTPAMTSARLLRYASFLQGFDYEIQHRKAEDNTNVDCLSRVPINNTSDTNAHCTDQEVKILQDQTINQISIYSITASSIANETNKDPDLKKLKQQLIHGENQSPEYSIQNNIIFKGDRVMIPASMRTEVLNELHRTHVGIVKMKQLARRYCFWRNIDSDIENLVRACSNCALVKKNPPKVIIHHWEEPQENFERVHMDYAGPFLNHHFFVLIDAKSKWPEIKITREAPTSEKTITFLENIFATHGLPKVLVSDNATIFQSKIFKEFCEKYGILQKFIAPGHPSTNGLAERHIQTLKSKLKAMREENTPLHLKVQEFLFRYRATPMLNNKSPAQMYLGRNLRMQLDAMKPIQQLKADKSNYPDVRQFSVGERVQVQWHEKNNLTWKFGHITHKFGRLHYQVKLDNGYSLKRHVNQLYKSNVREAVKVTGSPDPHLETRREPEIEINIEWRNNNNNPSASNNQPDSSQPQNTEQLRRSTRTKKSPAFLEDHVRY